MDLNLVWAALSGGVLGALAEWLLAAVLFPGRQEPSPDTWRRGGVGKRHAASLALALVTAAAFVALADKLNQTDLRGGLKLAAMIWLIGPLPLLAAFALSIRIDPLVMARHAAAWLAKLLLIGAATAWFL